MPLTIEATPRNEESATVPMRTCSCETCKLARFEGSKLRHAVIHQYSYKPRRWTMKSMPNDPYLYYLGVELETDCFYTDHRGQHMSDIRTDIAADMRRPKNLWVPKYDSSVSGPEFVSMPATLTYWHARRKQLQEMFQMLLHAGYRSHDNDTCGMHVNISRKAFDGSDHLYRFLTLIHVSPAWSLRMSQRTLHSSHSWANLDDARITRNRKEIAEHVFRPSTAAANCPWCRGTGWSQHGPAGRTCTNWRHDPADVQNGSGNKYAALHAVAGESRFEFRLPRGTLRLDRFYKNLEWTVAMVEYTRGPRKVIESRPHRFMKWVMENRVKFPALADFLIERAIWFAA